MTNSSLLDPGEEELSIVQGCSVTPIEQQIQDPFPLEDGSNYATIVDANYVVVEDPSGGALHIAVSPGSSSSVNCTKSRTFLKKHTVEEDCQKSIGCLGLPTHTSTQTYDMETPSIVTPDTLFVAGIKSLENELLTTKGIFKRILIRYSIVFLLIVIGVALVLLAILFIGAHIEARAVKRAPSTLELYTQNDDVCALSWKDDGLSNLTTFSSAAAAEANGEDVVHCGSCSQCSTLPDMKIMAETRSTLTDDTTKCAYRMFLGKGSVSKCMEKKIGFSPSCNDCWTSNIECTFNACKFTCLKIKLFGDNHNDDDGTLNECLSCDEVMCGPVFLRCSGANRRRMGILSDIGRDSNKEQCKDVDIDWSIPINAMN